MFLQVSVILSTGGVCVAARGCVAAGDMCGCQGVHGCWGGMHGCQGRGACVAARGRVWLPGGMHGCQGVCVVARRACVVAGGGGWHAWLQGGHVWLPGGACIGYDEIWSMSGRYASYWNAFL